jgi:hypothetical protein
MKRALLAAVVLLAAVAAGTARGSARSCGTLSVGPGALRHGSSNGPTCLLRAYRSCTAATFTLSTFGVDTIARDVFRVTRTGVICRLAVDASFEVIPESPHRFHATCRRVRRLVGDIVATGCTGALPATISLTGRH